MKNFSLFVLVVLGLFCLQANGLPVSQKSKKSFEFYLELAKRILDENVLVDGHNDLPIMLRRTFSNQFGLFDFNDIRKYTNKTSHTDLIRIKEGKLGAQFWVTYADCSSTGKDATRLHMEQIDTIKRLVDKHPDEMQFAVDVEGIHSAFSNKKVASMIGLESGHAIDSSLAILRIFYNLGVRYMTLTHNCDVPWATNNLVDNRVNASSYGGLTAFGRRVIQEMNRLGMLVDLSHTSRQTQLDAMDESKVPVIYSHSSVYSICNHTRNVRDDVLDRVKQNNGLVMVNFYNAFVTCKSEATIEDVIDHINYIKNRIGVDHVGIGSDYDGVPSTPTGLKDVADYPNLFARLLEDGWSEEDVAKCAGKNLLRVLAEAEKYAQENKHIEPIDDIISQDELPESNKACRTDF